MRNNKLIGTGVALVTPFNEDYTIDFPSLKRLIENLLENNIDYFVVMGTTAESATLSLQEQDQVIYFVNQIVKNKIPIVIGVGGNNTMDVIARIKNLDLSNVEAILCVSPYYNKPSQEGLVFHYEKIAEVSPVDIIMYNVPSRTAVNIEVNTVEYLSNKYSNIIAIKEASGNIAQCMDLITKCPDDFMIISGDDKMTLPIILLGGVGVISVQAMVFPLTFSDMVTSALNDNFNNASKQHYKLLKSVDLLYVDGNPSGIKEALSFLKICNSNQVRLPLVKMKKENAEALHNCLNTFSNKR
ncbi:MAG: 4-hydroxy-tetrahydrodipicolinate synthase [Flavobacteriales bacterium]|nr:4-hydroxy-tetrahydrodipicolinate synthase [Flavobacteriales bacterium]|tara:strand:- start:8895 stop:9791 length:897 start_codon:yes stop_codon:yes gene_type:complete